MMKKLNQLFLFIIFSVLITQSSIGQTLWLHTDGNVIKKSDGTIFAGGGANIFDTRSCTAGCFENPNVGEVARRIDELVDVWGADFMRLCLQSYPSLQVNGHTLTHGLPIHEDPDYVDDIVEIVDHIGTKPGVYVLVSLWSDPSFDSDGLPTEATKEEWKILVKELAGKPHVLFGICNEPKFNNQNSYDDQRVWDRMNEMVEFIRTEEAKYTNEKHIITVQGTRDYAKHIEYYVNNPITYDNGTNIAYESHAYFHEDKFQSLIIEPANTLPVILGEFGPAVINGILYTTLEECAQIIEIAEEHNIPYAAWSYHQRCDPNLLVDPTGSGSGAGMSLVATEWGQLLKDYLEGGIRIKDFAVDKLSVSNETDTEITISATVTNKEGTVESVNLDLSDLGGNNTVAMTKSGDNYTATYTVAAGTSVGEKSIIINAEDDKGVIKTKTIELNVYAPATEDFIIYTDNLSRIGGSPFANNGGAIESSSGGFEGEKHYQFTYNFSYYWANFGLPLDDSYDFSGYEAIQLACKIESETPGIIASISFSPNNYSDKVKIEGVDNGYQVFTVPLSSFSNTPLNDINGIGIDINGAEAASGSFCIDEIILLANYTENTTAPKVTDATVSPSYINNSQDTEITISATITNAESVSLNLSELGGGANESMSISGNNYTATYTITAGTAAGAKNITINAVNDKGENTIVKVGLIIIEPATEDMVIYKDNSTIIEAVFYDKNRGVLEEKTGDDNAFEGSNHYEFAFDVSSTWAYCGGNFDKSYDFSNYQAIKFACKLVGADEVTISLQDANGKHPEKIKVEGVDSDYKEFTVPLSSYSYALLTKVTGIGFIVGKKEAPIDGSLFIDNIVLLASTEDETTSIAEKSVQEAGFKIYPNPSSGDISIMLNDIESVLGLNIIDLSGKVIYSQKNINEKLIKLSNLKPGSYILNVIGKSQKVNKPFIVK